MQQQTATLLGRQGCLGCSRQRRGSAAVAEGLQWSTGGNGSPSAYNSGSQREAVAFRWRHIAAEERQPLPTTTASGDAGQRVVTLDDAPAGDGSSSVFLAVDRKGSSRRPQPRPTVSLASGRPPLGGGQWRHPTLLTNLFLGF